jgi:hypothetical protein
MARWFFVNGFVRQPDATRCSGSVGTATADNVTAAKRAASKPAAVSAVVLTIATREAPKDGSIIVTGNADTAGVAPA